MTALAALTMLVAPLAAKALDLALARRRAGRPEPEPDDFAGAGGIVLVIGFGRFGQVVDQVLLPRHSVTVIDNNVERIRAAARSASASITATARGSTCCAPPASAGRGSSASASTTAKPP